MKMPQLQASPSIRRCSLAPKLSSSAFDTSNHKGKPFIVVHHLNESRSQRILWLPEELGLDYEITPYLRDEKTRLAPSELFAIHPLGKSPVIIDCATVIHQSGAIVDYLVRLSGGKHSPAPASADYDRYMQWLHYAKGSAMLPLMLKMYTGRLGDAAAPLQPRIDSEVANHLGYVEQAFDGVNYLVGINFSAADVQRSFVREVAGAFGLRSGYTRQPTLRRLIMIYAPDDFEPLDAAERCDAAWGPNHIGREDESRATSSRT